jgi:hypothetical protein
MTGMSIFKTIGPAGGGALWVALCFLYLFLYLSFLVPNCDINLHIKVAYIIVLGYAVILS